MQARSEAVRLQILDPPESLPIFPQLALYLATRLKELLKRQIKTF